jgi:hypothetical protein
MTANLKEVITNHQNQHCSLTEIIKKACIDNYVVIYDTGF